jgi:hypothetical protein
MAGTMRIGRYEWTIKDASVAACVLPLEEADRSWGQGTNGLAWSFDIYTQPIQIDHERVKPHLYQQMFLAPVPSWRDLEGMAFTRSSGDDREGALICIHEHDEVHNAVFTFGKRHVSRFQFHFSGEYLWFEMKPDPITVDTWINFTGAVTYASSEQEAWRLVCQHLDARHLRNESVPPIDMTRGRYQYRFCPLDAD